MSAAQTRQIPTGGIGQPKTQAQRRAERKGKSNRPQGGGAAPGAKYAKTLEKEAMREEYRRMAAPHIERILRAQVDSAVGINHFLLRDPKTGRFERITDPDQILAALNAPEDDAASRYMIYARDPNQQAASDVLNRLMDKPKEQEQEIRVSGDADLLARLMRGRARG